VGAANPLYGENPRKTQVPPTTRHECFISQPIGAAPIGNDEHVIAEVGQIIALGHSPPCIQLDHQLVTSAAIIPTPPSAATSPAIGGRRLHRFEAGVWGR
jgi:hypothetical protein